MVAFFTWMRERFGWLIGLPLLLAFLIGGMLFVSQVVRYSRAIQEGEQNPFERERREASVTQVLKTTSLSQVDLARVVSDDPQPGLGNPQAKIHMVEFLDYQCPYCRQTAPAVRSFMARHMQDVFLTVRDFPLESIHTHAMGISIAARCVFAQDERLYWRFHDEIFAAQAVNDDLSSFDEKNLMSLAGQLGVDRRRFDDCFAVRAPEPIIRRSMDDGVAAGVGGTPTFFINGHRIQGALDDATLEVIFEQVQKEL